MKNKILIGQILTGIVLFSIGILVGKICFFPGVTMGREINPVHAMSILVSLLIACILAIWIDRHKEKNKTEKSLVIKRIDDSIIILESIHEKVLTKSIGVVEAASLLKRLAMQIGCLKKLVAVRDICNPEKFDKCISDISELKDLLTSTPAAEELPSGEATVRASDGIYYYSKNRISEIETKVEILKNDTFELQMEVVGK
jgi:hypothetical protein